MAKKTGGKGKKGCPQPRVLPGSLVISVDLARGLLPLLNGDGFSAQDRLAILNADGKGKAVANNRDPLFFDDLIPSNFRREGIWQRSLNAVVETEPTSAKPRRDVYCTPAGLTNLGNTCYANSALQVLFTNKLFREAIYNVEEEVVEGDATGMLSELRKLFLDMQFCDNAVADPRAFANMLKLQASEQQDAQEFQKLLMQRLEERLQRSAKPQIKMVLSNLYSGQSSYVTRCRTCRQESRMSSEVSEYFELDLQVKGVKSLTKSLQTLVAADALEGNNQYSCENCGSKQDADRQFCIRTLPPCLRINLQRFVFDWQSLQKQKCKDSISFPMDIDFTTFVHPVSGRTKSEPKMKYTLTAIILHRGSSASSGHYVSIVKDERLGIWWKYDDDSVTKMGVHPFKGAKTDPVCGDGEGSGASGAKKGAAKKKTVTKVTKSASKAPTNGVGSKGKGAKGGMSTRAGRKTEVIHIEQTCPAAVQNEDNSPPAIDVDAVPAVDVGHRRKRSLADVSDSAAGKVPSDTQASEGRAGKRMCPAQPPPADGSSLGDVQICSPDQPGEQQSNGAAGGHMEVPDVKAAALPQDLTSKDAYMLIYTQAGYNCGSCVPEHGSEATLPAGTRAILQSIQDARAKEDAEEAALQSSLKAAVEERREHIKAVVNVIKPDLDDPEDAFFIDAEWLTKWANAPPNEEMPAINNSDLLCDHNGLDPLAWDSAKRISAAAWGMLQEKWGGGPELRGKALCLECTNSQLEEIVQKEDTDVQRKNIAEQVKTCLEAPSDAVEFAPGMMLLSRKWIASWKARGCKLGYLSECMSPTASITCRHGKLLPAKTGKGSNRVAVTADVFKFISTHWRPVNSSKQGGNSRRISGGDMSGAGKEVDDVEMIPVASPTQPAGGEAGALEVHPDAGANIDINGQKGQENTPQNEGRQNGVQAMHIDDCNDVNDTVEGDKQAASAQDQPSQGDEEEEDDDIIIAAPTEDGVTARVSGKEDKQMREFEAMHAEELECPECSVLMSDTAQKEANLRKQVLEERTALRNLTSMQVLHLEHGEDYMLVPQMWLSSWRTWITGTPWKAGGGATAVGRGTEAKPKPADTLMHLDEIMAEFCVKDEESGEIKLLHELPNVALHRGKWTQTDTDSELSMTIVECDQWELLKQYHGSESTPDLSVRFLIEDAPVAMPPQAAAEAQPSSPVEVGDSPTIVTVAAAEEVEAGASGACMDRAEEAQEADGQACAPANAIQPTAAAIPAENDTEQAHRALEAAEQPNAVEAPAVSPGPQSARGGCASPAVLASSAAQFVHRHSPDNVQASASTDAGAIPVVPEITIEDGSGAAAPDSDPERTQQQPARAAAAAVAVTQPSFPGFQMPPRGVGEQIQTPHLRHWNAESAIVAAAVATGEAAALPASTGGVSAQLSDLSVIRAGLSIAASEPTTINISPASTMFGEGSLASPAVPDISPALGAALANVLASEPFGPVQSDAEQANTLHQSPVENISDASPSENIVVVAGPVEAACEPDKLGGAGHNDSEGEVKPTEPIAVPESVRPAQGAVAPCEMHSDPVVVRGDNDATCGNVDAAPGTQARPQHTVEPDSDSIMQPHTQPAFPPRLPQRNVRTASLEKVLSNRAVAASTGKKSAKAPGGKGSTVEKAAAAKPQVRSSSRRRGSTQGAVVQPVEAPPAPRTRSRRGAGSMGSASEGDLQEPAQPSGAQDDVMDVDPAPQGGAAATEAVQKVGTLHPSFTVCQDTIRQREQERRSALLTFQDMPLLCQLVTYEQAVTDNVPVASSKRSRRGRVVMTTSHSATLRSLKLRLYSELDVHPMNMDCYVKGRLLDSDDANLQQLQVAYTDVINIVKVDRVPNDDYALLIEWQNMTGLDTDVVVAAKSSGAPLKERGFVDTLLAGGP